MLSQEASAKARADPIDRLDGNQIIAF